MELEKLRDNLSALDRQILELIAQRQAMVVRIGEIKRQSGQTTRNFAREKQVLDMARAQAAELGIPPNLAEALMELLIRSSLTKQERVRVRAAIAWSPGFSPVTPAPISSTIPPPS